MMSLEAFQEQFRNLKLVESSKDQLIENLIGRIGELESTLKDERLRCEREEEATKSFQSRFHDAESRIKSRDDEVFLDHFIGSASQGGLEAARCLRKAVWKYLSTEMKLAANIPIRMRVYANIKGLASAYGLADNSDDMYWFVRGFNMAHPMCDFIDAGEGKECADSKLKAWFQNDLSDVQCQAILFGGSADNGYARLLQPCVGDESKSDRIILIEGSPFVRELVGLRKQFSVTRFPTVFRSTQFSSRPFSLPLAPVSIPSPNTSNYTAIVSASIIGPPTAQRVDIPIPKGFPVILNKKGQRLDTIITPAQSLLKVMRNRKQCNKYHILGECSIRNCNFEHGDRLDEESIEVRRWLARHKPCKSGLQCRDEKCLLGHQCPEKACSRIGNGCNFKAAMHGVDRS